MAVVLTPIVFGSLLSASRTGSGTDESQKRKPESTHHQVDIQKDMNIEDIRRLQSHS